MTNGSEQTPLPPQPHQAPFWYANRRSIFLTALLVGSLLFLSWLPVGARTPLSSALEVQRGLVALLFLFALVTLVLIWSGGQRLDIRVFMLFDMRVYSRWLDRGMWLATQLGNMLAAFIAAFVFFLLDYRDLVVENILGTLTLWLLVGAIRVLSDWDRPFLVFDRARVIGWQEKGDSFPRGHTAQFFFLATFFHHRFQLGIGGSMAFYAVATLVGVTRTYIGAHYPRDVIAGIVRGSARGILATI
jgi:membrane-associated phospholipid phosphatase